MLSWQEEQNGRVWRVLKVSAMLAVVLAMALLVASEDTRTAVKARMAVASSQLGVSADGIPGEGRLIKCAGQAAVYQIYGGKKRHIPNPATFHKLYRAGTRISTVSRRILNMIPTGPAYSNGTRLVKCAGKPHIYLQTNGQKLWICNPSTFNQYSFDWKKVKTLPMKKCKAVCNGPILCNNLNAAVREPYYSQLCAMGKTCKRKPPCGSLVKCKNAAIYQVFDGRKRHIPNPATFNQLYGRAGWAKVLTYPKGFCKSLKTGRALSNGASLIRCGRLPHIFLLSNGRKRWICDPKSYHYHNFQFSLVKPLSAAVCRNICNGKTICLTRVAARRQPYLDQLKRLGRRCRRRCKKGGEEEHETDFVDGQDIDNHDEDFGEVAMKSGVTSEQMIEETEE